MSGYWPLYIHRYDEWSLLILGVAPFPNEPIRPEAFPMQILGSEYFGAQVRCHKSITERSLEGWTSVPEC